MIMSATLGDFALRFPLIVANNVVYAIKAPDFDMKSGAFSCCFDKKLSRSGRFSLQGGRYVVQSERHNFLNFIMVEWVSGGIFGYNKGTKSRRKCYETGK